MFGRPAWSCEFPYGCQSQPVLRSGGQGCLEGVDCISEGQTIKSWCASPHGEGHAEIELRCTATPSPNLKQWKRVNAAGGSVPAIRPVVGAGPRPGAWPGFKRCAPCAARKRVIRIPRVAGANWSNAPTRRKIGGLSRSDPKREVPSNAKSVINHRMASAARSFYDILESRYEDQTISEVAFGELALAEDEEVQSLAKRVARDIFKQFAKFLPAPGLGFYLVTLHGKPTLNLRNHPAWDDELEYYPLLVEWKRDPDSLESLTFQHMINAFCRFVEYEYAKLRFRKGAPPRSNAERAARWWSRKP
jgi:hypothetical protein